MRLTRPRTERVEITMQKMMTRRVSPRFKMTSMVFRKKYRRKETRATNSGLLRFLSSLLKLKGHEESLFILLASRRNGFMGYQKASPNPNRNK